MPSLLEVIACQLERAYIGHQYWTDGRTWPDKTF